MRSTLVALLLGLLPSFALAQAPARDARTYLTAKLGAVVPQHDDMEGFGNGFALEGALGYRASENVALEFGLGRFSVSASEEGFVSGVGTVRVSAEMAAIPITGTVKLIAPADQVELFGLFGGGLYLMSMDVKASAPGFVPLSENESDTTFAVHFGGGLNVRVSPRAVLGAELKFIKGKAEFFDVKGGFDSFVLGALLAFSL